MNYPEMILAITAILTALIAGLFYAWSVSVMPGFARLNDREFVDAMQATNRAIQNPLFFVSFFGAPLLLIVSTVLHYGESPHFWYLLAATIVLIVGMFGVTVAGNVPLNNTLERFDLAAATAEEIARQRTAFERRWNNLNTIRTIAATLALLLVVIACLKKGR